MPTKIDPKNKPVTWGEFDAPPVWGHGAKGDTIYKPGSTPAEMEMSVAVESPAPPPSAHPISRPMQTARSSAVPDTVSNQAETVFNPNNFVAKAPDISVAKNAVTGTIRRAALWFLVSAAAGGLTWWFYHAESERIAYAGAFDFVVFLLIGAFAYRLSRVAFLAALIVYGLGTVALVAVALMSEMPLILYIKPLIARCGILYKHYRNYGLLTDLHQLENG